MNSTGEDLLSPFTAELQARAGELQKSLESMTNFRTDQVDKCKSKVEQEIGNLIDNAKDEVANTDSCKAGTEEVLNRQLESGLEDLIGCLNRTKSVHDGELLTIEILNYEENITDLISTISKNITDCQKLSFFKTAVCVIENVNRFSQNTKRRVYYIIELEDKVKKIVNDVEEEFTDCVELTVALAGSKIKSIFKANCGVDLPEGNK